MKLVDTLCLLLLSGLCNGFDYNNKLRQSKYDFIVVGAGSAGSVLANRLSENGKFTVLLLEAGGIPPPMSEVPIFSPLLHNQAMDWRNVSVPQKNACQEQPQGLCTWSRAKVLGGCSTHNNMCFVRGNKKDYDNWERLGATGWNYENVLKTFKDIENNTDPAIRNNGYHGTEGLQTVSTTLYKTKVVKSFLEAAKSLGHKIIDDYNGAIQQGFGYLQLSQRDGLRCGTEKAFLRPAADRSNLDILIYAFVLNITFDHNRKVKSVFFEHENQVREVPVAKEVIVSAGTISSPLVLMRSGIGPKKNLHELKIPVIMDLPVGHNFQDHPFVSYLNYLINDTVGIVFDRDVNPDSIGELVDEHNGPLTSPGFMEAVGFYSTKYQNASEEWPDIQVFIGSAPIIPVTNDDFSNKNGTGIVVMLTRPKSRGSVKLRSRDPHDDPIVDPRYFTDEGDNDLKRLLDGVKRGAALLETPYLQRYSPVLQPKILPGCEGMDSDSDDYMKCAVQKYLETGLHMAGTCKMGRPNDPSTVVDPELRVKGVKGLRVADASIMPTLVTGNLNAACVMIGRRAADMILSTDAQHSR